MHHTRQNYITQIKTACRETGTVIPNGFNKDANDMEPITFNEKVSAIFIIL